MVATGGMGEVYRAEHLFNGRPYALKMIKPEFASDESIIELFRREAGILESIKNPVIVSYRGLLLDEHNHPFIVMEYVDGPSLKDLIGERTFTDDEIRLLRDKLAAALDEVHQRGVVHRDISPDNILFHEGKLDQPRIIDFGIARQEAVATVIGGSFAGKYRYASPEQLGDHGGQVDGRSDIYSLGLVLATAAQGEPMEIGGSLTEILDLRREVPDLSKVPRALRAELAWMLQPNPDDRPARARDLIGAETRLATDEPRRKPKKRERGGGGGRAGAVIVVALLLIGAMAGGAVWWVWSGRAIPEPVRPLVAMLGLEVETGEIPAPDAGGGSATSGLDAAVDRDSDPDTDTTDVGTATDTTPDTTSDADPAQTPPQASTPDGANTDGADTNGADTGGDPASDGDSTDLAARPPLPDLNDLAATVPCSGLSVARGPGGTARVTGYVGSATDLDRLRADLADVRGVEAIDTTAVEFAPPPLCATLGTLNLWGSSDGPGIDLSKPDGEYRPGEFLQVTVQPTLPRGYVHVAFIDADERLVFHLLPNPVRPDASSAAGRPVHIGAPDASGASGERVYEVTPPYGRDMILAAESTFPIFPQQRPEIESLQEFLEALLRRRDQAGEAMRFSFRFVDIVR
nr:serine/threonine-protein kinase [uncultured Rhodospira sp.]